MIVWKGHIRGLLNLTDERWQYWFSGITICQWGFGFLWRTPKEPSEKPPSGEAWQTHRGVWAVERANGQTPRLWTRTYTCDGCGSTGRVALTNEGRAGVLEMRCQSCGTTMVMGATEPVAEETRLHERLERRLREGER